MGKSKRRRRWKKKKKKNMICQRRILPEPGPGICMIPPKELGNPNGRRGVGWPCVVTAMVYISSGQDCRIVIGQAADLNSSVQPMSWAILVCWHRCMSPLTLSDGKRSELTRASRASWSGGTNSHATHLTAVRL